jgi:DNA-binding NarL/FixJ family response regulator
MQVVSHKKIISIIHADDHPITRKGVEFALAALNQYKLLNSSENGMKAMQAILTYSPDIALLDVEMPEMGGLDVAAKVLEEKIAVKIVLLTSFLNDDIVARGEMLHIQGFVAKECALDEIHKCLDTVMNGEKYVSPMYQKYFKKPTTEPLQNQGENPVKTLLSKTEFEILKLIAQNMTTPEIAEKLFTSPRTVDTHRYNICKKLNINGSHGLLSYALAHKEYF